ncbi:MAG: sulfatase, partial [Bryobacteraceae bacterium]
MRTPKLKLVSSKHSEHGHRTRMTGDKEKRDDEHDKPGRQLHAAWHLNQRESTRDARPFLIYLGFSHPHDTRDGKPELLAKYGAVNHADKNSLPP